MTETQGRGNPD